jgi:hypothetical protein
MVKLNQHGARDVEIERERKRKRETKSKINGTLWWEKRKNQRKERKRSSLSKIYAS